MNNNISDILILILLVIVILALPIICFVFGCKKHKRGLAKAGAVVLAIYSWFIGFAIIGGLSIYFRFNALGVIYLLFGWIVPWGVYAYLMEYLFDGKHNPNITDKKKQNLEIQNMWSKYEQDTMDRVNNNWLAYLQRARQEDQSGKAVAGNLSLDSLLHNFLWCVYDLSKYADKCQGSLSIQSDGDGYNVYAFAYLTIDESSYETKYQVLFRTMVEEFFINTPGLRLEFSDDKKDTDHADHFPWVSKDHSKMIPTTDYYVTGMHFAVSNILSMRKDNWEWLKTLKDVLEYEAKDHIKYGLNYTIAESRNGIVRMDFTSRYIEPQVD